MFATVFFGILDCTSGSLMYINGGHELPAIVGSDGVRERLRTTGPAVGMIPDAEFGIEQTQLNPGDILFTFTDGVPDARNPAGKLYTEQRLLSLLIERANGREPDRPCRYDGTRLHRRGRPVRRHHHARRAAHSEGSL